MVDPAHTTSLATEARRENEPATNPLPPLVTLISPPVAGKPNPGLLESLVWCVIFLATQTLFLLLTCGLVLAIFAWQAADARQFLLDELDGFGERVQARTPGEPARPPSDPSSPTPRTPGSSKLGVALAYGMLGAQFGTLGLILLVFPWRIGSDWRQKLHLRRPAWLHVILVILLVPGFIILSSGLQELAQKITGIQPSAVSQTLSDLFRSYPWFLTFLAVALGPGVVEELWCRGFLGRGLTARYGTIGGVLVTSTLFGLIHLDLSLLIPITLMGVFLHFVYLTSRSLGISILLHTMNNGISVFATLAGVASVFEADSHEHCLGIYLMSFALVCSGSIALWTSRPRLLLHQSLTVETPLTTPELPGSAHHQLTTASAPLAFHTANSGALIFTVVSFAVLMFLLLV